MSVRCGIPAWWLNHGIKHLDSGVQVGIKHLDSGASVSGFKAWLSHIAAEWPSL